MKTTGYCLILILACVFFSSQSIAEKADISDEVNAKMAREKARMRRARSNGENASDDLSGSSKCGSIEIGNAINQRGARGTKEITVVIDGDVINANNKCN